MKLKHLVVGGLAVAVFAGPALAAPGFTMSGRTATFQEGVNDAMIQQAKSKVQANTYFNLKEITDADLAAFVAAFPDASKLKIYTSRAKLTSIAPLASLAKLEELDINSSDLVDLSPLAGLTKLTSLTASYGGESGDLSWMSKLTNLKNINLSSKGLTSLNGLPVYPTMKRIRISNAKIDDLTPLAALTALEDVDLSYAILSDLTPLTKLPNMKRLNLYGATLKDFSPLAACPKLEKLTYYATKGCDYSTLGALTQITQLDGGLTKLDNIAWVANLKNLKKFDVFAEYVKDYTPLAGATALESFKIWSMRVPVGDLGFLSSMTPLKELILDSGSGYTNFAAIGTLPNLQTLRISDVNNKQGDELFTLTYLPKLKTLKKLDVSRVVMGAADFSGMDAVESISFYKSKTVDLSTLKSLSKLTSLSLDQCTVKGLESIDNLPALARISLRKTEGVTSLDALKKLPALKQLSVTKGAFTDEQLAGFPAGVRISQQ